MTAPTAPMPETDDPDFPDGRFTVVDRDGQTHILPGIDGMSLMEILRAADMPIAATCGGAAACGTCHVYLAAGAEARVPPPGEDEEWQLDHLLHARPGSRLACQILWSRARLDGLALTLAPEE